MPKSEFATKSTTDQAPGGARGSATEGETTWADWDARQSDRRELKRQWRSHDFGAGRTFWAAVLIGLGILFLINNYHPVPEYAWTNLGRLWPLVIIFPGLRLLAGRGGVASWVITVIGILVIIGILGYAAGAANLPVSQYFHHLIPPIPAVF